MKIELTAKEAYHLWWTVQDTGIRGKLRDALLSDRAVNSIPVQIEYTNDGKWRTLTVPSLAVVAGELVTDYLPAGAVWRHAGTNDLH